MNEYFKTIKARTELAKNYVDTYDNAAAAANIYEDVINDLMNMIKILDTHIETMREVMKGEK